MYCLYAVVSGIYLCFLSEHGDVKAFYNIIFFFIAVCLVGLVEELVFRGVVFNLLLRAFPKDERWNHRSRSFGRRTVWIDAFFQYGRRG